jgi:hypothetical protein
MSLPFRLSSHRAPGYAKRVALVISVAACASHTAPQTAAPAPTPAAGRADTTRTRPTEGPGRSIAARTSGMERRDGFIPLYLDAQQGRLFLEIPRDSLRALYFLTEATGLGSNPIGLDRGGDGREQLVRFDRSGPNVLVVFENLGYRTSAHDNPDHARTVREAFPPSTVAALPLVALEEGRMLVDATDFFLRDWLDVAGTLARSEQGSYAVARDRSSINANYTKAFPKNSEIDAWITYAATGRPGNIVSSVVPDGRSFTLRQHVSLVALPDDDYHPRVLDPRVGFGGITFKDYAQPIQSPLEIRWIGRHRLERVNPDDPSSPIKNPLVYYVDRGIPEPLRTATKQGVSWWVQAFDRAGLKGGFRVEDLPEGADPMDARYNVVQWENRNERGWSVGGSLGDPRTGEIIKAMARLDSHRARTDYNIYAGLVGAAPSPADTHFVLARVRQVSAHEVGHTLGMAHNYIASTYERGSVMDYPPPRVMLDASGNVDLSQAYASGPGDYDVWAIHWAYGIFPRGGEQDSLRAIIAEGLKKGYLFLSDADARPEYGSDPRTNLWDDASATVFLKRQTDVRRVAIAHFGERNIRPGEPVALLQERFVPMYFFHRFALNAVAKTIGGMEYSNAVVGDGQQETRPIDGAQQRRALAMLTAALQPEELAIPDTVLTLLGPRPFSYRGDVELFGSRTRPAFDELGAARTLSQMILDLALQPDRAARVTQFAARERNALTLSEEIDSLIGSTWNRRSPSSAKLAALQRVTQRALADELMTLAANHDAAPEVRAMADLKIVQLRTVATQRSRQGASDEARANWLAIANDLGRWLDHHELPASTRPLVAPPGDPFGEP